MWRANLLFGQDTQFLAHTHTHLKRPPQAPAVQPPDPKSVQATTKSLLETVATRFPTRKVLQLLRCLTSTSSTFSAGSLSKSARTSACRHLVPRTRSKRATAAKASSAQTRTSRGPNSRPGTRTSTQTARTLDGTQVSISVSGSYVSLDALTPWFSSRTDQVIFLAHPLVISKTQRFTGLPGLLLRPLRRRRRIHSTRARRLRQQTPPRVAMEMR
jgi:hypothetical protein